MIDRKTLGAAALAASIGVAGGAGTHTALAPKPVQVMHSVNASKHAWPDLSDAEKTALAGRLGALKGRKVIILCNLASCNDLAEDVDDVLEAAGADSSIDRSMLGSAYGFVVFAPEAELGEARALAAAVAAETGGRLKPEVKAGDPAVPVTIAIGKRPR